MNDPAKAIEHDPIAGLCSRCLHARRIDSARGSTFILCELSRTNPRFAKYPRLPVLSCDGFQLLAESADKTSALSSQLCLPIVIIANWYYIDVVDLRITHLRAFVSAALVCVFFSLPALADKLRITTVPSGATVQINGVLVGATAYEVNIPGGYLHKTKTSLGSRLEHPMVARLTLEGYAAKEIQLAEGSMSWFPTLKGPDHGAYWLLKTDHFSSAITIRLANLHGLG